MSTTKFDVLEGKPWPLPVEFPNKFKVGDVVRLRSGGPQMTVTKQLTDYSLVAAWNLEDGSLAKAEFPEACLTQ